MKHIYKSLLLALFLCMAVAKAYADGLYDAYIGGIYYLFDGKTAIVSNGDYRYAGNVDIPEYISYGGETYKVVGIRDYAFYLCRDLTGVTIPNTVTKIGENSFCGCERLPRIIIPDGVTELGQSAFHGCNALAFVHLPPNLTEIPIAAFKNCISLNAITIPDGVTIIGSGAFSKCSSLKSVNIPESVTTIEHNAFSNCSSLTSVFIPYKVTDLQWSLFYGCTSLTSVTVDIDTPLSIYHSTFPNRANATLTVPYGCKGAYSKADYWSEFKEIVEMPSTETPTIDDIAYEVDIPSKTAKVIAKEPTYTGSVSIPESIRYRGKTYIVTGIDGKAFRNCTELAAITIPSSVTTVGYNAFSGCTSLESASISSRNVGSWFANCTSVESVTLHGVETIGDYAFAECSKLRSVAFYGDKTNSIGEYAFSHCSSLDNIIIPNSVKSIGNHAFSDCALRSITLSNALTSISTGLLRDCRFLLSINIPKNVKIIGSTAFLGCRQLSSVTFPEGMERIEDNAFYQCSNLASVFIPRSVTNIDGAFGECNKLTSVSVDNETPIPLSVPTFSNRANATLYVPLGSAAAYAAAPYWQDFKNILTDALVIDDIAYELDETTQTAKVIAKEPLYTGEVCIPDTINVSGTTFTVTSIGDEAFKGCTGLTSVSVASTVASIGRAAFSGCTGLTAIDVKEGLESIGANAFYECSNMSSFTIPESVTSIGSTAFRKCNALTSITIPGGVTSLDSYLFQQCEGLKEATLSEGLTGTGVATFWSCTSLKSVKLPSTLTKVDMLTFDRSGLEHLVIPEGVTAIDMNAFSNCKSLYSISFPSTLTNIESYAFGGCTALETIYCFAEETPQVDETAFNNVEVKKVRLGVPDECVGAYKKHPVWSKFLIDFLTDIDALIAKTGKDSTYIYNVSGQRMDKMQKGINIIGGKKVLVK